MQLEVISKVAATSLPGYSTTDVKNYLRIDYNTDDALLDRLFNAAEAACSSYCDTSFSSSSYIAYTPSLDDGCIVLPIKAKDISVTRVVRVEPNGTETELVLNTDYYVQGLTEITIKVISQSFTLSGSTAAYKVEFTASWGTISSMPTDVIEAIYKTTKDLYDNRGNVDYMATVTQLPMDSKSLLARYRQTLFL